MSLSLCKYVLAAIFSLFFSLAYASGPCDFDLLTRARLKMADQSILTSLSNRFLASDDPQSELKLFLTFKLSKENVWGKSISTCNTLTDENTIARYSAISSSLEKSPSELRAIVRQLMRMYPTELVKHSSYVMYEPIADLLEGFIRSETKDLNTYLQKVETFRDSFLEIMKPNRIQWSMGIMPSDSCINSLDNKNALLTAQNEVWDQAFTPGMGLLVGSGIQPTTISIVNESAITLINASIDDFALLYDLGLTPEAAVSAVTAEMRSSGHGYLRQAALQISKKP